MNMRILSDREFDVMKVLWNSDGPLLASEIRKADPDLQIPTIQVSLRKLIDRGVAQIAEKKLAGATYGRTYMPAVSMEEYVLAQCREVFPDADKRHDLLAALVAKLGKCEK